MNPNARRSSTGNFECLEEDSGVDLNRNWGEDFGVSESIQVGLILVASATEARSPSQNQSLEL